jgi:hypothetical protein
MPIREVPQLEAKGGWNEWVERPGVEPNRKIGPHELEVSLGKVIDGIPISKNEEEIF